MSGLDSIKNKLKRFFIKSAIPSNHIPKKVYLRGNEVIYQYEDLRSGQRYELSSENGFDFSKKQRQAKDYSGLYNFENAVKVKEKSKNRGFIFYGDREIKYAIENNFGHIELQEEPVISEASPVELSNVFERVDGFLIFYLKKEIIDSYISYSAYLTLVNSENPKEVVFKLDEPIWRQSVKWQGKSVLPLGSVLLNEKILSYWFVDNNLLFVVSHTGFLYDPKKVLSLEMEKHIANPIVSPYNDNDWEAFTTLNPAAFAIDDKVHVLYRAQGFDYISKLGYARFLNGTTLEHRSKKPIYAPQESFETNLTNQANSSFTSAGGYGGCEDPRVTQIDDKLYMTYVAFDGWSPPRVALTSIKIDDFLQERWNWEKPVLISKPGVVDKSGCILSEKIRGKYVIFHRVFPNIQVDFVDSLNFDGETNFLKGEFEIKIRPDKWDSRKIGAGAPPLKTKEGWLLIYYGVDDKDDSKYQIGAMLLDLNDPTKVLHRTDSPIIKPEEDYEMNGFKPGIVYPCGAVILKDQLMVYYGGADSHVCVATADLEEFLIDLTSDKTPHLHSYEVKEVKLF